MWFEPSATGEAFSHLFKKLETSSTCEPDEARIKDEEQEGRAENGELCIYGSKHEDQGKKKSKPKDVFHSFSGLITSRPCGRQTATCDLYAEVSSDTSPQILIHAETETDFSLLMPTPCGTKKKRAQLTQKPSETAPFNPPDHF